MGGTGDRNERKDTSVSLKEKKPKLFPELSVMSERSQSVGYTVHVSCVHFLQSGTRAANSEWDRQEMGARAADVRTALVLDLASGTRTASFLLSF